ncbi:MAG: hypothetical protein ACOX63_09830 [Christensenellales bacterium]|jgi:hypothetical protein
MTTLQEIKKKEDRACMQTPDPVEQFKNAGTIIGTITGALGLAALIKKGWNKWREKHPPFRRTVLTSLDQIKCGQKRFEDFNAATLRERLGSAYLVYVKEHGWCPRSQKEKITVLFDLYKENYGNTADNILMDQDKAEIMALPESEEQRLNMKGVKK